ATLVLDCFPDFLVDDSHLGRRQRVVPYAREAQEIARKLRPTCMQNKGSAHSQDATEKTGFEHNVISRRRLTRPRLRRSRRAARRPVILCKDKRREIDFLGEFKESLQCRRPWIEGCHPGFDARDVAETARQCLKQLLLFP